MRAHYGQNGRGNPPDGEASLVTGDAVAAAAAATGCFSKKMPSDCLGSLPKSTRARSAKVSQLAKN